MLQMLFGHYDFTCFMCGFGDRSLVDLVPDVPASLQALVESDSEEETDTAENAPAVSLATADADGHPSVRMVLL